MDIPRIRDFEDYNKYPGEDNPTTDAEMQAYMDNQNKVLKASAMRLWQPSTDYEEGATIFHPHRTEFVLVCVVPGVSAATIIPEDEDVVVGDVVEDGDIVWMVEKIVTEAKFTTATHEQITELVNS